MPHAARPPSPRSSRSNRSAQSSRSSRASSSRVSSSPPLPSVPQTSRGSGQNGQSSQQQVQWLKLSTQAKDHLAYTLFFMKSLGFATEAEVSQIRELEVSERQDWAAWEVPLLLVSDLKARVRRCRQYEPILESRTRIIAAARSSMERFEKQVAQDQDQSQAPRQQQVLTPRGRESQDQAGQPQTTPKVPAVVTNQMTILLGQMKGQDILSQRECQDILSQVQRQGHSDGDLLDVAIKRLQQRHREKPSSLLEGLLHLAGGILLYLKDALVWEREPNLVELSASLDVGSQKGQGLSQRTQQKRDEALTPQAQSVGIAPSRESQPGQQSQLRSRIMRNKRHEAPKLQASSVSVAPSRENGSLQQARTLSERSQARKQPSVTPSRPKSPSQQPPARSAPRNLSQIRRSRSVHDLNLQHSPPLPHGAAGKSPHRTRRCVCCWKV